MRDPKAECARWLSQAESDLAFARYASDGRFFHQACFHAQQAAEKALEAVHYNDCARAVLGHFPVGLLARLLKSHPDLDRVRDLAAELDLFYLPTRPERPGRGDPARGVYPGPCGARCANAKKSILPVLGSDRRATEGSNHSSASISIGLRAAFLHMRQHMPPG
jgi:HEPN domain-containing protein